MSRGIARPTRWSGRVPRIIKYRWGVSVVSLPGISLGTLVAVPMCDIPSEVAGPLLEGDNFEPVSPG